VRTLNLAKTGLNKLRSRQWELKSADFEDSLRSLTPGEWCCLVTNSSKDTYYAFVNPLVDDRYPSVHVVHQCENDSAAAFSVEAYIETKLAEAIRWRHRFKQYSEGCRLFYGTIDGLPGLIIDVFVEVALIQINTAGVDKYRELIQQLVSQMTGRQVVFLDNPVYRQKEFLPIFERQELTAPLSIKENGLSYEVRLEVLQKVGFYYDHRENRQQLRHFLGRLNAGPVSGLDLFCYTGAWGINALAGGVQHVTFVDQGELAHEISCSLKLNNFENRGEFIRQDVFKFLDAALAAQKQFDLVLCDPPAFAKSAAQRTQALEGYSKLHRKVFKLLAPGAMVAFSSCTHYVSPADFEKNITDAAHREGKSIRLLHSGIQGWDHPISSQFDKSNYIKSFFYLLE
jgi:23S rRNA (cytosine1962-C5)-methyltransferase